MHAQQRGKATYYSKKATGSRASDGSRVHHDSLTCAHRTHPFGTLLKVTNLSNGKHVVVKVTDRGPFAKGRIIDLSYRAAREIGLLSQGVAMVEVEVYNETLYPLRPEADKFHPMEFDIAVENPDSIDVIHSRWNKMSSQKKDATHQPVKQTPKTNRVATTHSEVDATRPKKH